MDTALIVVGSLVAAAGTVPYIIETVKGKTKPRVVSWLTWALLAGLAAAAAIADRQWGAALFAGIGALALGSVLIAGLRYADRSFAALDIVCLAGVGVGLVLWYVFNTPAIAVWAVIIIDFIGLVPTLKHAWEKPGEETPLTYALAAIGGVMTTVAVLLTQSASMTGVGYSLYVALSLGFCALLIMVRRSRQPALQEELTDS
jgi:hypothetical protein